MEDGLCRNVYSRIYSAGDDDDDPCIYTRLPGTDWCRCTLDICLEACSNSFLCGNEQEFRWLLKMNDGRCRTCQTLIGQNIRRKAVDQQALPFCSMCMLHPGTCTMGSDTSLFCIECVRSIVF